MNTTRQLIAATVLAVAGSAAFAGSNAGEAYELNSDAPAAASSLSRADVQAQVVKARAAGQLLDAGEAWSPVVTPISTVARAQVKAEVLAARAKGELVAAGELLQAEHPTTPARKAAATNTVAAKQ